MVSDNAVFRRKELIEPIALQKCNPKFCHFHEFSEKMKVLKNHRLTRSGDFVLNELSLIEKDAR
jgi:hypothetical protein